MILFGKLTGIERDPLVREATLAEAGIARWLQKSTWLQKVLESS